MFPLNGTDSIAGVRFARVRLENRRSYRPADQYRLPSIQRHEAPMADREARRRAGVPGVKVAFAIFKAPDAMNDALLSGAVDIVSGGPAGRRADPANPGRSREYLQRDATGIHEMGGFSLQSRTQQGECRVVEGFVLARDLGLTGELKRDFWARRVGNFRRCRSCAGRPISAEPKAHHGIGSRAATRPTVDFPNR